MFFEAERSESFSFFNFFKKEVQEKEVIQFDDLIFEQMEEDLKENIKDKDKKTDKDE